MIRLADRGIANIIGEDKKGLATITFYLSPVYKKLLIITKMHSFFIFKKKEKKARGGYKSCIGSSSQLFSLTGQNIAG